MQGEPPVAICHVAYAVDSDTLSCRGGRHIRLAGISGLERSGACNSRPDCPTMPYARAKAIVQRLTYHQTYRFRIYGRSHDRLVGDNPALRCAILTTGAAVEWRRYSASYGLSPC